MINWDEDCTFQKVHMEKDHKVLDSITLMK